jgi:hypothetical protein
MSRPRIAVPIVLTVAAVAAAGVAAATRHTQSTQAAAADINAGMVSRLHSETCTASDGVYQLTTATYTGTAASGDARLNGAVDPGVQRREHDDEARLARRHAAHPRCDRSVWNRPAAIANDTAVGSLVGQGERPGAKLIASFSAAFTPASGFANGKLGSGSANGAGILFTRGPCRQAKRPVATAMFHLHLTPNEVVPRVRDLHADGNGNLTLDLTHDASGNVTGGNVVFYVNYSFRGPVTITGLALHQGARGSNGPVVLDAAVGTVTDSDGRGNLTRVVNGASASLLQALLQSPHGYYVDLTTSANPGGALRDQLNSPNRR